MIYKFCGSPIHANGRGRGRRGGVCVWLIDKFAIGCGPQRLIRFCPAAVSLLLILPAHYVRERKPPQSHNNSNKSSGKVWGRGGKGGERAEGYTGRYIIFAKIC